MAKEGMDTTSWILLAIVFYLLISRKTAKAATSTPYLGAGASGAAGAAGAPGKSLLQQILSGPTKPTAGSGGGGSAGAGSGGGGGGGAKAPSAPLKLPSWMLPARNPVALAPQTPLTSLIPSIPPPTWDYGSHPYPGDTTVATIPSDTSNLFIMPDEPPSYEQPTMTYSPTYTVTSTVFDTNGNPIPVDTSGSMGDAGTGTVNTYDPTSFSPVDTQTVDTSNLGMIPYLPDTPNAPAGVDETDPGDTMWFDGSNFSYGGTGDSGGQGAYGGDYPYDYPTESFDDG